MQITTPTAEELAFVYDSWANSFRKSAWAGCVPNHMWEAVSREMMRGIVDRGAVIVVAVTPIEGAEGRRVMGYAVAEPDRRVLHWLYVKRDFRRVGIGRQLLTALAPPDEKWTYTCRTHASSSFLGSGFRWDPVAARVK